VIDFDQFLKTFGSMTRGEFLEVHKVPQLLVGEFQIQETTFQTARLTRERLWSRDQQEQRFFVVPLAKREGSNAFASMVTFGRAGNNDLVFEHDRVSKFHGYFREVDGAWFVCDATSQNGTTVAGQEVVKGDKQGAPLESGAKVCLGEYVDLIFYTPEGLHEHCQKKLRG
jgi:FHA domain-containing protein